MLNAVKSAIGRKLLTALLLAFLLLTPHIFSQTKTFALGFEGTLFPDNTYHQGDSLRELHCNLWQGWDADANTSYFLSILKNLGFKYALFQPDYAWTRSWGQQTIYQAEETKTGNASIEKYKYNNHHSSGTDITENGNRVRYYSTIPSNPVPGYILSAVDENFEQTGSIIWWENYNKYRPDVTNETEYTNTWYIKPRMRIDSTFASNNPNTFVAKIEIYSYDTTKIKTINLRCRNFRLSNAQYTNKYLEEFFYSSGDTTLEISANPTDGLNKGRNYNEGPLPWVCGIDYKIYWYGTTNLWIDYVKVEDFYSHNLLKGVYNDSLINEMSELLTAPGNDIFMGAFTEEIQLNNMPCINYINTLLASSFSNDPRAKVLSLVNEWTTTYVGVNRPQSHQYYMQGSGGAKPLIIDNNYQFWRGQGYSEHYWLPANISDTFHFNNFFPQAERNEITNFYSDNIAPNYTVYNNYLQDTVLQGWADTCRKANDYTKGFTPAVDYWVVPQFHHWKNAGHQWMREPLNEELSAVIGIALANGTKGIMPYTYLSGTKDDWSGYDIGMLDFDEHFVTDYRGIDNTIGLSKRKVNFYGQNKWDFVKNLYGKIELWGQILANSPQTTGYSVYRDGANHEFINNVISIDPYRIGPNNCLNDNGLSQQYADFVECPEERYWEMGFFSTSEPNTKYFMMVNRRCVPAGGGYAGDDRVLRVKFNLSGSINWKISEVGSFNAPKVFDKREYAVLGETPGEMGWFLPGEGKLFKLQEVPRSGGTLVADEIISGESFTCEAPVYNNGFNITIGANTTVHFNDSSKFVMSGGVFTVGDQNTSAPQNITSDAVPGGSWHGHSFSNCEVKIYGATFSGLANDTTYAVNIIDCPVVDIRNCTFNTNSSLKGGINAVCFDNPFIAINNIYIGSNTFNSSGSTIPTVNVSSYAGVTTPLIIENNTFNEGNTAVFLSGVIGGAIKGNTITDNYISINALTSSIDVVQNTISSTVSGSMGIFAAGGSEVKLNSSGAFTLGGLNTISNEGTGTNNINVDGSYFLLDDGENIFNISSDQSSYHLYGFFPMFTAVTTEETNNCFKVNSSPVDPPINMVTSGYQGSQITFNFNPYLSGCEIIGGGDGLAIDLGDGIYDTIYTGGSGSGGGQSSVASELRSDNQAYVAPTAKTKYDSISVLMRYRSYSQAKIKCLDLISTYPDSIQSIFAVSKLFLATVASDTSYNAVNTLKIFYENLILNHQSNTSLVKRANYYILKCKVRMGEYSQALAGFQQIINQNPYSYEGLIARWDYMATSLLIQGQGGGEPSITNYELGITDDSENDIEGNDDDKKPFTKEQRQDIRKSINTAIEISKNDDEVKIKKLEEKSELGDVNASKELTQMKSLKQVVKTEKPKSIIEHVRIVSEDIRKVFGTNTSSKGNEPKNIPLVYKISQNYPNPFNPVTKINYDLPRDSKVKIVIYDILGREVKRLVNNELKTAGSYIVDFNASNYASGVYFYRIEAEEPNGNKFVDSKKMVLLK